MKGLGVVGDCNEMVQMPHPIFRGMMEALCTMKDGHEGQHEFRFEHTFKW